jgi:hypothetical protein
MARKKKQIPLSDRLVGIRSHKKRDLFEGCNDPNTPVYTPNPQEFQQAFCRICRNEECIRAQGATTPWHHRMENQMDNLFNHPQFSDLSTDAHKQLAGQLFNDLRQKAERLEIARERQDWEIPEGPTDGYERTAASQATNDVNDAIKALKKAKGQAVEEEPEPEVREGPKHFQEAQPEEAAPENDPGGPDVPHPDDPVGVEYETQYPKSDGTGTYRVWLMTDGVWECECKAWRYKRKCPHMDDVGPWYEQHKNDDQKEQAAPEPVQTQGPPPKPVEPTQLPPGFNTPMPRKGVMVGGEDGPSRHPSQLPRQHDPWAPRQDTVVPVGGTVVMKSKKK